MKAWVARDRNGGLYIYSGVPTKEDTCFLEGKYGDSMAIRNKLFPEVTFENSPQEVEIKLVKK